MLQACKDSKTNIFEIFLILGKWHYKLISLASWDIGCLKYFKHVKNLIVIVHTLFCHLLSWLVWSKNRQVDLKTQKRVSKQNVLATSVSLGIRLQEVFSQIQSAWLAFSCVSVELLHFHIVRILRQMRDQKYFILWKGV